MIKMHQVGAWLLRALTLLITFTANAQETTRPAEVPVDFQDLFEADSRAEYRIEGDVQWSGDRLSVAEKSLIGTQVLLSPEFKVDLEIRPIADAMGRSVTRLNFLMTLDIEIVVRIIRLSNDANYKAQMEVFQSYRKGKVDAKVTKLSQIPIAVSAQLPERWELSFNYGVLHVGMNGKSYGTTYVESDGARCAGIFVSSDLGITQCARLAYAGTAPQLRPEQKAALATIQENDVQATKLAIENLDEWLTLKRANVEVIREAFGENNYAIGFMHHSIGIRYEQLKSYQESAAEFDAAYRIWSESLGENHPRTLFSRITVGTQHVYNGQITRGLEIILPHLARLCRVAGTTCQTSQNALIISSNSLRHCISELAERQEYQKCLRCCRQLQELNKVLFGNDAKKYYLDERRLEFLQTLVDATGQRKESLIEIDVRYWREPKEPLDAYENLLLEREYELLALCREHLGDTHPMTLETLLKTANEEVILGGFGKALQLVNETVKGYQSIFGTNHPAYAASLAELASFLSIMGRSDEATPLFDSAIDILAEAGGHWDRARVRAVMNRGRHRIRMNQWFLAEQDLFAAYEMLVKDGMESGSMGLQILERLTDVYRARSDLINATAMLDKHRDLVLKTYGVDSEPYCSVAYSEAIQLEWQNQPKLADAKYADARQLAIKHYGRNSRMFYSLAESEFGFQLRQRNSVRAEQLLREMMEFERHRRDSLYDVYSDSEQFAHSLIDLESQNRIMLLATAGLLKPSQAYQLVLSTKGSVAMHQRQQAFARRDPKLKDAVVRLQEISGLLTKHRSQTISVSDTEHQQLVAERQQINQRIAAHARKSDAQPERMTPETICQSLEPGSVVIDYVQYAAPRNAQRWNETEFESRMAAFVYSSERSVELIQLGTSEEISKLLLAWIRTWGGELASRSAEAAAVARTAVDVAGVKLRKLVLDPILAGRQQPKSLVISPAGDLTFCSFGALPIRKDGTLLIEDVVLSYTIAAQLIHDPATDRGNRNQPKLLLVGDVDYGEHLLGQDFLFVPLSDQQESLNLIQKAFARKYGSGNVICLMGDNATEDRVRESVSGARIVHIQTHGFCVDSSQLSGTTTDGKAASVAGLALADANSAMSTLISAPGVLWDEEMVTLDWTNADLVMLSACQSTLGDIKPGEGMQGLHRALAVSGAATSITTLWSVLDLPTKQLVEKFYHHWFDNDLTKSQALRQAQIDMIRSYQLPGIEYNQRCPMYLWAAFVLYGAQ